MQKDMNTADFRSLYEYVTASRHRFLDKCREVGWNEFVKNHEASWTSMRGIFVHLLEVEDSWLHYDVSGKTWPYSDRDPSAFKSFDEIAAYDRELGERTRKFLEEMTDEGLARMVSFEWRDRKVESSVENILIHTFIDEVAHIGEFICLLWQIDIKPPHENWIASHLHPN
ncbi:MAG: DinB family protein [Candidatus Bathyarchaeia archaeon]|jgi:uncharacterized damage-inducible protein DinB